LFTPCWVFANGAEPENGVTSMFNRRGCKSAGI
jgi:hypothetical protein